MSHDLADAIVVKVASEPSYTVRVADAQIVYLDNTFEIPESLPDLVQFWMQNGAAQP